MKEFKSYNVKITETPTTIEIWEYLDNPIVYSVEQDKEEREQLKADNDLLEQENKDDTIEKKKISNQYVKHSDFKE